MENLADRVRSALGTADLEAFRNLLDDNVRWGPPGDASPPCQNREQVLAWYAKGRAAGVRATVSEVIVMGDQLLVGLAVIRPGESEPKVPDLRWQLLSIQNDLVREIVGFDHRHDAEAYARRPQ